MVKVGDLGITNLWFLNLAPAETYADGAKAVHNQTFIEDLFSGNMPDIHLVGTPFQLGVWQELAKVKSPISYEALAIACGNKRGVRAVATAVANNPIPYFIPCHLIVRKSGEVGHFRYGSELKKELLRDFL